MADVIHGTGAPGGGDDDPRRPPKRKLPADKLGARIRPKRQKKGTRVMTWTEANDNKVLLFGIGRHIRVRDHQKIASTFQENPTHKAIQERMTKLRDLSDELVEELRIIVAKDKSGMPTAEEIEEAQDVLSRAGLLNGTLQGPNNLDTEEEVAASRLVETMKQADDKEQPEGEEGGEGEQAEGDQ